jgi:MYXO-CTERM domain-containing protein
VAGLLASAAGDKTSAELYEIMIRTARPAPFAEPDANGHDPVYGYGIIDPVAALEDALGISAEGGGGAGGGGTGSGAGGSGTGQDPEDDEGCDCRAVGEGDREGTAYFALALLMLLRRRRA